MKRLVAAAFLAGALFIAGPGEAFATFCLNANKPDGAGNFGDVIVDFTDPSGESDTLPTNPGGQVAGGFVDVFADVDGDGEADFLLVDDTFVLNAGQPSSGSTPGLGGPDGPHLSEGAHNAAGCGRGVDHAEC